MYCNNDKDKKLLKWDVWIITNTFSFWLPLWQQTQSQLGFFYEICTSAWWIVITNTCYVSLLMLGHVASNSRHHRSTAKIFYRRTNRKQLVTKNISSIFVTFLDRGQSGLEFAYIRMFAAKRQASKSDAAKRYVQFSRFGVAGRTHNLETSFNSWPLAL